MRMIICRSVQLRCQQYSRGYSNASRAGCHPLQGPRQEEPGGPHQTGVHGGIHAEVGQQFMERYMQIAEVGQEFMDGYSTCRLQRYRTGVHGGIHVELGQQFMEGCMQIAEVGQEFMEGYM